MNYFNLDDFLEDRGFELQDVDTEEIRQFQRELAAIRGEIGLRHEKMKDQFEDQVLDCLAPDYLKS